MLLANEIRTLLAGQAKVTPSGWVTVNCPMCVSYGGEPTADDRHRGGFKINYDGAVGYNCFRCKYSTSWTHGSSLNKKMQSLLHGLGMSREQIKKLNFHIWKENQKERVDKPFMEKEFFYGFENLFEEKELPKGSKPIIQWLEEGSKDPNLLDVCNYLLRERGERIATSYDYYWNPNKLHNLNRSVMIPFYYNEKTVGYTARRIDRYQKVRYHSDLPANYLFMNHNIQKPDRKFIILVEGVFDAIAIDGVAALGGSLTDFQIQWLNSSEKDVIVVPDREKAGGTLIDIAIANGWYVSVPFATGIPGIAGNGINDGDNIWSWQSDLKDCADCVKRNGRLYTVASIDQSKLNAKKHSLKINMYRKFMVESGKKNNIRK